MEHSLSITAVVVVYNVRCENSSTCRALMKGCGENVRVLIYDNSTSDYGNADYCEKQGWFYLGGSGNVGLSKAYNAAVDFLRENTSTDMICLFDDDTDVRSDYFDVLAREARKRSESGVFVPVIEAGDRIVSPFIEKKGHRVKTFKTSAKIFEKGFEKLGAINSCMAIRTSVFDDYRYDENIFLDGIDHKFISDMRKRGIRLEVIGYTCTHSLSALERPSKESAVARFRIFSKDYRYIFGKNKLAYLFLVGKRALRLTAQYKSLRFIRLFFKSEDKKRERQ